MISCVCAAWLSSVCLCHQYGEWKPQHIFIFSRCKNFRFFYVPLQQKGMSNGKK